MTDRNEHRPVGKLQSQFEKKYFILLFSLKFGNLNVSLFAFSAVLIWDLIFQQIPGTFFIAELPNDGWKNMLHCSFRPFVSFCVQTGMCHAKKETEKSFFRSNFENSSMFEKFSPRKRWKKTTENYAVGFQFSQTDEIWKFNFSLLKDFGLFCFLLPYASCAQKRKIEWEKLAKTFRLPFYWMEDGSRTNF